MTSAAQRTVNVGAAALWIKQGHCFVHEHGCVLE
jgi:hypothetical protein